MSKIKYASSLVLALAGCGFLVLGQVCRYAETCELVELLWKAVLFPLLVIAACFAVRDLRIRALRWQAVLALVVVVLLWVIGSRIFW
jgi:hypothetical protein